MVVMAVFAPCLGTVDPQALAPIRRLQWPSAAVLVRHRHARPRRLQPHDLRRARVADRRDQRRAAQHRRSASRSASSTGFSRWVDAIVMRIMDGLMSIPAVLIAIALMALTRASMENVIFAITVAEVPRVTRLVRGVVLTLREQPFVEAAHRQRHRLFPHPVAAHRAQHAAAAAGAGHLHRRLGDDHRGDPVLSRRRHPAQHPELGQHHGRGAQPVSGRLLHRAVPRHLAVDHGAGDQPARRRAARRARPAPRAAACERGDGGARRAYVATAAAGRRRRRPSRCSRSPICRPGSSPATASCARSTACRFT